MKNSERRKCDVQLTAAVDHESMERTADEVAAEMATWLRREYHHLHRGVVALDSGGCIGGDGQWHDTDECLCIFGNDSYSRDARSRCEVELLREKLAEADISELGFGLEAEGVTWAMVVVADDSDPLLTAVWEAWFEASNFDVTRVKKSWGPARLLKELRNTESREARRWRMLEERRGAPRQ